MFPCCYKEEDALTHQTAM